MLVKKIEILVKSWNFGQKFNFSSKIKMNCQKIIILAKIEILVIKCNFKIKITQSFVLISVKNVSLQFWPKVEIYNFGKKKFGKKSVILV